MLLCTSEFTACKGVGLGDYVLKQVLWSSRKIDVQWSPLRWTPLKKKNLFRGLLNVILIYFGT